MDIDYKTQLSVTLRPIGQPWVRVTVANHRVEQQLTQTHTFDFEFDAKHSAVLMVEHFDKTEFDIDTAVEVTAVKFFGIDNPQFVWAGIYRPCYPSHLQNQLLELPGQSYLGWNGVWQLNFDLPVFVWMHKILAWGWLYS